MSVTSIPSRRVSASLSYRGDGVTAKSGSNRVNRGGSWNNNARNVRSANRNSNSPGNRNNNIGFRLVSTRWRRRA